MTVPSFEEWRSDHAECGQISIAHPDRLIATLAARQHGVVSRGQLLDAGVTGRALDWRLANGRLLRLHRGVFAVGHARLTREGRWLAAVLASGPGAVLSHRSAAALHDLRPDNRSRLDVTTPRRRASTAKIDVHARRPLDPADRTVIDGVPVTSVSRTLVDLAGVVATDQLVSALREADRRRTFDLLAIEAALERTRGRRGSGQAAMHAALAEVRARAAQLTRSRLEDRFAVLTERSGLPTPRTNVWFADHQFEVDALWDAERVAVELDSWREHGTRDAFHRDRRKANALTLEGWRVLRFTHDDVTRRPAAVAEQLRAALGRCASGSPPGGAA